MSQVYNVSWTGPEGSIENTIVLHDTTAHDFINGTKAAAAWLHAFSTGAGPTDEELEDEFNIKAQDGSDVPSYTDVMEGSEISKTISVSTAFDTATQNWNAYLASLLQPEDDVGRFECSLYLRGPGEEHALVFFNPVVVNGAPELPFLQGLVRGLEWLNPGVNPFSTITHLFKRNLIEQWEPFNPVQSQPESFPLFE